MATLSGFDQLGRRGDAATSCAAGQREYHRTERSGNARTVAVNVELAWREAGEAKAEIEARAAQRFAREQAEYEARKAREEQDERTGTKRRGTPRHLSNLITRRPLAW